MDGQPLSHSLLQRPPQQGGLGAMQSPPPQPGNAAPAMQQRQIEDAASTGQMQYAQFLQQQLSAGLPSQQEARRAAEQQRKDYIGRLAPQERSGLDTFMAGLGAMSDTPTNTQVGNFDTAMRSFAKGAEGYKQGFEGRELAKSKEIYDTLTEAGKTDPNLVRAMSTVGRSSMTGAGKLVPLPGVPGMMINNVTREVYDARDAALQKEVITTARTIRGDYATDDDAMGAAWQMVLGSRAPVGIAPAKAISPGTEGVNPLNATSDSRTPLPGLEKQEDVYAIDDKYNISKAMFDALPSADKATASRVINRYVTNPNEGTTRAMEQELAGILAKQGGDTTMAPTSDKPPPKRKDVIEETRLKKELELEEERKAAELRAKTPGTPEYERVVKDTEEKRKKGIAQNKLVDTLTDFRGAITDVLKAPNLESAVGWFDASTPAAAGLWNAQDKATATSFINRLKDFAEVIGLQDIRATGVAPGSVTEKEWPKFRSLLGTIDPSMDNKTFKKTLRGIDEKFKIIVDDLEKQGVVIGNVKQPPSSDPGNQRTSLEDRLAKYKTKVQ